MDVREMAKAYTPPTSKNITELKVFNLQHEITKKECMDKDNKPFIINEVEVEGETYRVPTSVIKQIKAILEVKPDTIEVKVTKTGEGLNTTYNVIQL